MRLYTHGPQPTQCPQCFRKMKLAPSPTRNCGLEDQTAEHILQKFPLLQKLPLLQTATIKLMRGQRQSSYTPNSAAARRNWRRQLHSSCRQESQCSSDREEVDEEELKSNRFCGSTECWQNHAATGLNPQTTQASFVKDSEFKKPL